MKTPTFFLVLSLSVVFFSPSYASIESGAGKIDSVTVYSDRASVLRKLTINTGEGENQLDITNIPSSVDDSSIRVQASGETGVTILNVQIRRDELEDATNERVVKLEKEILSLQREIKSVDNRIEASKSREKFIDRLAKSRSEEAGADLTTSTPSSKPTVEELGRLLSFIYEGKIEAGEAILLAGIEKEELAKRLDKLARELHQARGVSYKSLKTVSVDFVAESVGKVGFTLEYIVPGASWSPEYLIRARPDIDRTAVSYKAFITQNTGEEWKDVKLSLSTASPRLGASAPEISEWIVRERPQLRRGKSRVMREDEMSAPMAAAPMPLEEAVAQKPGKAKVATSKVASAGTSVTFKVKRRDTIPSGGERTAVTVAELIFDARTSYLTVPKISPYVYMRTSFTNGSSYPLLAGPTNIFIGDSFAGKGDIKAAPPGEEVKLDLGVDEGFAIERELVKKNSGQEGILSKTGFAKYIYQIKLKSLKKRAVTVKVQDHLPLSSRKEIVVRDIALTPKPDKRDEKNIVTWNIFMEPGKESVIRIEFSLQYPPEMRVMGLP